MVSKTDSGVTTVTPEPSIKEMTSEQLDKFVRQSLSTIDGLDKHLLQL